MFWSDLFLMNSVKETKNPIGFKIYLFKNNEKINITKAIANTVLIIKSFLFNGDKNIVSH